MKQRDEKSAFSLVEVVLTLGIAAFCLIAVYTLLPVGLASGARSVEQTAASSVLSDLASALRSGSPATNKSARYDITIPPNPVTTAVSTNFYFSGPGQTSASISNTSRFRVTVTFLPNGNGIKTATFARIKVSWPAAASDTNSKAMTSFVALDRN